MSRTVPTNTKISRPLVFLTRLYLTEMELEMADGLCAQITDWEEFSSLAARKFALPLVYRNLQKLGLQHTRPIEMEKMRETVTRLTFSTLAVSAEQRNFHHKCVLPNGFDPVYFKGPSLAARFYGDIGLRYCRDVDVLVRGNEYEPIVRKALELGYTVHSGKSEPTNPVSDRDIRAILKYNDVTTLLSPNNIAVEIHRVVSKNSDIFNTQQIYHDSEKIEFAGESIRIMDTNSLFAFVCYHNTRHTWSRLNWLADLDAITRHPSFDLNTVLEHSDHLGLKPTVEACLAMKNIAFGVRAWSEISSENRGNQLLNLCIQNLEGDLELERQIRSGQGLLELPFDWMLTPNVRRRTKFRNAMSRIKPDYEQYSSLPLPDNLQWAYYLARPIRGLLRYTRGLFV